MIVTSFVFGKSHCAAVCRKESQQFSILLTRGKTSLRVKWRGGIWEVFEGGYLRRRVFWGWENVAGGPIGHCGTVVSSAEALGDKATEARVGAGLQKKKGIPARFTKWSSKILLNQGTAEYFQRKNTRLLCNFGTRPLKPREGAKKNEVSRTIWLTWSKLWRKIPLKEYFPSKTPKKNTSDKRILDWGNWGQGHSTEGWIEGQVCYRGHRCQKKLLLSNND